MRLNNNPSLYPAVCLLYYKKVVNFSRKADIFLLPSVLLFMMQFAN